MSTGWPVIHPGNLNEHPSFCFLAQLKHVLDILWQRTVKRVEGSF